MLESGFQPFAFLPAAAAAAGPGDTAGSSSAAELLQRQQQLLLPVLQGNSSVYTLAYHLPGDTTKTASIVGSSSSHDAAADVRIEVKAVDVGHHLIFAGSLRTAAAAAAAAGESYDAGTGAASSGNGSSSSSSKLVLSLSIPKSHIILLQSSTLGADSAGAAHAAAGTAAVDTAAAASADKQNAQADPGTSSIQQQQQQPGWPLCSFSELQQLWVLLKDRLCLPLLIAGCAAAGLAAPVGLASLLYEMQEAVLALLAVSDPSFAFRLSQARHGLACYLH
jgi:hypothetical protein